MLSFERESPRASSVLFLDRAAAQRRIPPSFTSPINRKQREILQQANSTPVQNDKSNAAKAAFTGVDAFVTLAA
jgi:hypothetical protein